MSIHHIVMFRFKADASAEAVQETCTRLLGLKDACLHPSTASPYIKSAVGGRDNSIEGLQVRARSAPVLVLHHCPPADGKLQSGITHVFVLEFESAADRDHYVNEDLAHRKFVETFITGPSGVVAQANVVDFTPGAF
ncbi:Uncharacterized protein TPAR_07156 [Tolypocladium paradoxum]|uniref:Stress-response A/B barrel domain-containing protein n=1 Tax=Tolypocladium paradoxum TaxID=94208 RepID=A0A2S4KR27_9HYPO|nr:Uncharacterized protein TPAR_07156 [Tolypocladium paradoxum]